MNVTSVKISPEASSIVDLLSSGLWRNVFKILERERLQFCLELSLGRRRRASFSVITVSDRTESVAGVKAGLEANSTASRLVEIANFGKLRQFIHH